MVSRGMESTTLAMLTGKIFEALRLTMRDLRVRYPTDTFYYFGLITSGELLRPCFSACSVEGMSELGPLEKWSLPDSPHVLFGDEHFGDVEREFLKRDAHTYEDEESCARLTAMIRAIWRADQAGFFGGDPETYLINVEIQQPDASNRERILLLNRSSSLRQQALVEACWP